MLDRGPGDGKPVVGGGAAPDLIEDHQRALAGLVEDGGGLHHLDHEGGAPAREIVSGAYAGEEPVYHTDACFVGRHERAIWARTAISAFWRRKVLLPAMLGPVTSQIRAASPRLQPLGTKGVSPPTPMASTRGACRP